MYKACVSGCKNQKIYLQNPRKNAYNGHKKRDCRFRLGGQSTEKMYVVTVKKPFWRSPLI